MRARIILASVLGAVITLQCGAFSVVLETTLSGITELPFGAFAGLMLPIHLAIGLVEGLVTGAILTFVYQARPEMLTEVSEEKQTSFSLKKTLGILAVVTLFIGGGLSLYASGNPDGLEWALFGNADGGYAENMGLDEEELGISSGIADTAAQIQETTSFLPDYAFKDNDSAVGTTVSGIVGSGIVAGFLAVCAIAFGFFRSRKA